MKTTTTKLNANKTNERTITNGCIKCGNVIEVNSGMLVHTANTYGYICNHCKNEIIERMQRSYTYSNENTTICNKPTKTNNCTISSEIEISNNANVSFEDFIYMEYVYNCICTYDCTVKCEIKTPIYNNMLGFTRVLRKMCHLFNIEDWNTATDYGTHLNIGNTDLTPENIAILRRFYHSLFVDFCDYLKANEEKTTALHGRYFMDIEVARGNYFDTPYANTINQNTSATNHANFINLQHDTHIEFRLCKLVTPDQYMMVARMYQEIVQKVICDYFLKRYNENTTAEVKKALAKKASQKMIKIFNKYYDKLTNQ